MTTVFALLGAAGIVELAGMLYRSRERRTKALQSIGDGLEGLRPTREPDRKITLP